MKQKPSLCVLELGTLLDLWKSLLLWRGGGGKMFLESLWFSVQDAPLG